MNIYLYSIQDERQEELVCYFDIDYIKCGILECDNGYYVTVCFGKDNNKYKYKVGIFNTKEEAKDKMREVYRCASGSNLSLAIGVKENIGEE